MYTEMFFPTMTLQPSVPGPKPNQLKKTGQTGDVYSFIALPNRRDYEICFMTVAGLQGFTETFRAGQQNGFWQM